MKVTIEVAKPGSIFGTAAQQIADARQGRGPDYRLSFESARSLFAELKPVRLDLLNTLSRVGPCPVNTLANAAERDLANVTADVARLEDFGLIDRAPGGAVSVPFDTVEIIVPLARVA
jgi:predicted transcriptional regulator